MFSEPGGNGTASIVGFGPVKRDAEKCTTGTTRHAWIQLAHNSPVQLEIVKITAVRRMQGRIAVGWCTFDSVSIE